MSKPAQPAPKHRGTPRHAHLKETPKRAFRNTMVLSSVALAVTGVAVGGGVLKSTPGAAGAAADLDAGLRANAEVPPADTGDREPLLSRSDQRGSADPAKAAGLADSDPAAMTDTRSLSDSDPKDIARALLGDYGFSADQFNCLDLLWTRESGWNPSAENASSGAYGIPQSLPGSKMATVGSDWATNPVTQIKWGLGYIQDRYGSPCGAWGHSEATGWY
ncbi:transglycosylase SLT domain-containing protein [Nocardioides panacisoli]|uniref:Transglycosylase SLT domain-containing protein n=1 Tax=Nocardioides panacisoli TaxID=627624 RepID=A0ABP7IEK6_9ACTN